MPLPLPQGDKFTTVGMAGGTGLILHTYLRPIVVTFAAAHPTWGIDPESMTDLLATGLSMAFLWFKQTELPKIEALGPKA